MFSIHRVLGSLLVALLPLMTACGGAGSPNQAPAPAPAIASDPDPRLETYDQASWPEAGPLRDGLAVMDLSVSGWNRADLTIDPRLAQADLAFATPESTPRLFARVRVHDDIASARADMLASMRAATVAMEVVPGYGDIAYGVQNPNGLAYLVAARGNIVFTVRAPELDAEALELVANIDNQIQRSPAVAALAQETAPRFAGSGLRQAQTGQSRSLELRFAPGAPAPVALTFKCSENSAGIAEIEGAYAFSCAKAGEVMVQGFACSDRLRRSRFSLRVTVAASAIDAAFTRADRFSKAQRPSQPGLRGVTKARKTIGGSNPLVIKREGALIMKKAGAKTTRRD